MQQWRNVCHWFRSGFTSDLDTTDRYSCSCSEMVHSQKIIQLQSEYDGFWKYALLWLNWHHVILRSSPASLENRCLLIQNVIETFADSEIGGHLNKERHFNSDNLRCSFKVMPTRQSEVVYIILAVMGYVVATKVARCWFIRRRANNREYWSQ